MFKFIPRVEIKSLHVRDRPSAWLYAFCLGAGIMHHPVHAEKWAKGWPGQSVLSSLQECRGTWGWGEGVSFSHQQVHPLWCLKETLGSNIIYYHINSLKRYYWGEYINGLKRVILRGIFLYICMLCANMDVPMKHNSGTFSASWLPW